ncbi:MAG: hypothetical protein ACYTFG_20585 [Planctomycetota bacterium]
MRRRENHLFLFFKLVLFEFLPPVCFACASLCILVAFFLLRDRGSGGPEPTHPLLGGIALMGAWALLRQFRAGQGTGALEVNVLDPDGDDAVSSFLAEVFPWIVGPLGVLMIGAGMIVSILPHYLWHDDRLARLIEDGIGPGFLLLLVAVLPWLFRIFRPPRKGRRTRNRSRIRSRPVWLAKKRCKDTDSRTPSSA